MDDVISVGEDRLGLHEPATLLLTDDHEGVTVLRLVGEHDMASADALERRIEGEIGAGRNVVVSLQDTEFLDSTVVAALYRSQARMSARGVRLVLHCGPESVVHRLLHMTSLIGVVASADTLAVALEIARS
jgi:anti-anti-sigma factor